MKPVVIEPNGDHIRDQLRRQGIRMPLHATASLERSRQAVAQLFLCSILSVAEVKRFDNRYIKLVKRVLKTYGHGRRV